MNRAPESKNMSMSKEPNATEIASAPVEPKRAPQQKPKMLPPYNVVLLNDDDHTYEYVILMLGRLFGCSNQRAYSFASQVDTAGRAVVQTTHKELAELKRDQIHAFGADARLGRSAGSMSAIIEPAP